MPRKHLQPHSGIICKKVKGETNPVNVDEDRTQSGVGVQVGTRPLSLPFSAIPEVESFGSHLGSSLGLLELSRSHRYGNPTGLGN